MIHIPFPVARNPRRSNFDFSHEEHSKMLLQVGAMRAGNVYRPTEDTRGRHRLLLADLADTVLQHAKVIMQGALSGYLMLHEGCAVLGWAGLG